MPHYYKHKGSKHFLYEKVKLPYFGPWKNAILALQNVQVEALSEYEYLDHLREAYPKIYENLEWVRFYNFQWRGSGEKYKLIPSEDFRFRLAVTNVRAIPEVRDYLFEIRQEITEQTGWYPLVQGCRALATEPPYNRFKRRVQSKEESMISIGKLQRIIDVSGEQGGNSFLIKGELGTILFDTGFNVKADALNKASVVCLSHFHKDHSGGIWSIVEKQSIPIFLSESSLAYLWELKNVNHTDKIKLVTNSVLIEKQELLKFDGNLEPFSIFHCPGSYGFRYTDTHQQSIYYCNDVCLRNGFLDFSSSLFNVIKTDYAANKWVILDAAMVGKSDFTIESDDSPKDILAEITLGVKKRNVIFLSNSPEMLIYAYILCFKMTRECSPSVKLVLNDELYSLIKRLWRAVLLRDENHIDPFVSAVIGKSKSNFIESQRVYPLSTLAQIKTNENVIIYATVDDLQNSGFIGSRVFKGDVIFAGTLALRNEIPPEVTKAKPRSILRIASEDWVFHSAEQDLADFVNNLTQYGIKVLLCHNYPKVLRRFIKRYGLDTRFVFSNNVSEEGISII